MAGSIRIEAEQIIDEVDRISSDVEERAAEIQLREATEEELLAAMLCVDSVLISRETIHRATRNVAQQIFIDEYHRRAAEGEAYKPPIVVPLMNGGVKFALGVTDELATMAADLPNGETFLLDLDPVMINPSFYKESQTPGNGDFEKGYTKEERERMSGRHVILVDDGLDRAVTIGATRAETIAELTGPMPVPVKNDDGEIIDYRVVQLDPPLSFRTAALWVKARAAEDADYYGAHIDNDWINGYGCNTVVEGGDSVGRNIRFIARSLEQPEE